MACSELLVGGQSMIICGGRRQKACYHCGRVSIALCDFPTGKHRNGRRRTCSRELCDDCRQQGVSANVDFCLEHYPLAKAAYERRQASRQPHGVDAAANAV
jgi:hypothetical protein